MKPEDVRKLVGGYAMGTLTHEERQALLEAALSDQDLFNELAREQALKDLLEDPRARRELLNAVEERQPPAATFAAWWKRPVTWALAGGLATAAVLVAIFVRPPAISPKPEPVLMAKRETPPVTAPSPSPPRALPRTRAKVKAPAPRPAQPQPVIADNRGLASDKAEPKMTAVAVSAPEVKPEAAPTLRQVPAAGFVGRATFAALSSPVPYRLLRADAAGGYVEAGPDTVFRREDRVRVVFEPDRNGRLVAVAGASKTPLVDVEVTRGAPTDLDVPPGESRLTVTFTPMGQTGVASFEIQIRRE